MMFFYLILFLHTIIKVDKTLILQQLWKMKELKRAMNISTFLFIPIFFFFTNPSNGISFHRDLVNLWWWSVDFDIYMYSIKF